MTNPEGRDDVWNMVTLKEHLEVQIANLINDMNTVRAVHLELLHESSKNERNMTDAAIRAQEIAVDKAFAAAAQALAHSESALAREFHEHLTQYRHEVELQLAASDKAIAKAEMATERRFESVNGFRTQLNDQASTFMTRAEYDAAHDSLTERVNAITDRINRSEGKGAGAAALYGWAVAGVGLLITVIIFMNTMTNRA